MLWLIANTYLRTRHPSTWKIIATTVHYDLSNCNGWLLLSPIACLRLRRLPAMIAQVHIICPCYVNSWLAQDREIVNCVLRCFDTEHIFEIVPSRNHETHVLGRHWECCLVTPETFVIWNGDGMVHITDQRG